MKTKKLLCIHTNQANDTIKIRKYSKIKLKKVKMKSISQCRQYHWLASTSAREFFKVHHILFKRLSNMDTQSSFFLSILFLFLFFVCAGGGVHFLL